VRDARATLAVAFTVIAWASAFVAIRAAVRDFTPGALALGRLALGTVVLGVLVLARRRWTAPNRREWLLIVLCGLTWFAAYNVVLNAAERRIDAGTTAMLVGVGPILIALLAGALLGEGFPRWLLIGAGVAFLGAILVGLGTRTGGDVDIIGVVLALAAAITYAIGVLAQKPVLRRLPALQVTFLTCSMGALACLPFAGSLVAELPTADLPAVAGLVYLAVVPMALAFLTWGYALARMDAGRLSVTTYLVPPITIVLSALLLREWPPALAIAGGVVCLIGVGLTRRSAGPRHRSPDRIIRPEHDGSTGTGSPTNPRTRDRAP
jgi:drug/metabolite transporter (DMT)-like permease